MRSVNARSLVFSKISFGTRQRFKVSYVADRSTKTAAVTSLFWNRSSMCCVRFRSWLVVDLPGRNPACCGAGLLRIRCSNSLYKWRSREIGQKLFAYAGSLPDFRRMMILVFLQFLGCFLLTCSCSSAQGPTSMSDVQCALSPLRKYCPEQWRCLFLRVLMLTLSSSRENGSVSPVFWECWSRTTFGLGCLVVDFLLSSNWCATWLTVVVYCCCVGVDGSLLIFWMRPHSIFAVYCNISCLQYIQLLGYGVQSSRWQCYCHCLFSLMMRCSKGGWSQVAGACWVGCSCEAVQKSCDSLQWHRHLCIASPLQPILQSLVLEHHCQIQWLKHISWWEMTVWARWRPQQSKMQR